MRRILAGIETEYGLQVSGRGAAEQIDDAAALVRSYPGECLPVWDYRYESPRADLRGFQQARLNYDPEDAKFDVGRSRGPDSEVRSDRILPNGARLYNDHGHPEYSTPECWSLEALAKHDQAGELAVLAAARSYAAREGVEVRIYKNNTDFHGASYGTHENYLVPRSLAYEQLLRAVTPMLVVRQLLTGAGKVGSESGAACNFQLSQRADFFTELANVDTLYRRPIFNTRDEPHSRPSDWIRLHVISGDANMMPACTARKVALVKLAVALAEIGEAPVWHLPDPVRTFQQISRDPTLAQPIELTGRNWTTVREIFESYFAAAEARLDLDAELCSSISECRSLLDSLEQEGWYALKRDVEWAAKRAIIETVVEGEGMEWSDPTLQAYDLEYSNVDPEEGLYHALVHMGEVQNPQELDASLLERHIERTRAYVRGVAVSKFRDQVQTACWRSITFDKGAEVLELELPPDMEYPEHLQDAPDVESFIKAIGGTA